MNSRFVNLMVGAAFVSLAGTASAATPKKAAESYSATEEGAIHLIGSPAPVAAPAQSQLAAPTLLPPKAQDSAGKPVEVAHSSTPGRFTVDPVSDRVSDRGVYDTVPNEQVDAMAKRLTLVEQLIRKFHRAYDYKVHTLKELEGILAKLEAGATATVPATTAAPAPTTAPAPAQIQAPAEQESSSDEEQAAESGQPDTSGV